jgi:hypothetical protein
MTRARSVRTTLGTPQPVPSTWVGLIGLVFDRLVVVGYTGATTKHKQKMITCLCECGFYVDVMVAHLRSGNTTSCGCAHSAQVAERNISSATHGDSRGTREEGTKITVLYRAWAQIKQRCLNPKHDAYADYGGRGIKLHPVWAESYAHFRREVIAEIGEKPSRFYSIDRKNNDGGYEPGNIRWATPTEQNRNQRTTHRYELNGESLTIGEWAERAGVKYELVASRVLRYGWPLDEALGTPPGFGRCPLEDRVKWKPAPKLKIV